MMNTERSYFGVYLVLAVATFFLMKTAAQAQTVAVDQRQMSTDLRQGKNKSGLPADSGHKDDDIEQLRLKVDRLLLLLERQQRAMSEMEERLNSVEVKARIATLSSHPQSLGDTAGATEPIAPKTESTASPDSDPGTQSIE